MNTVSPAARFGAVFATLFAAHHWGDFLVSNDEWSDLKPCRKDRAPGVECSEADSWKALAAHVASYHAAQLGALAVANRALGLGLSPRRVVAGVALSAISHAITDRRWPVRVWMDNTGSTDFRLHGGGAMHVDQAMHYTYLAAAGLIMSGDGR